MSDVDNNTGNVLLLTITGDVSSPSKYDDVLTAFEHFIAVSNPSLSTEQRRTILMDQLGLSNGDLSSINTTYETKWLQYRLGNTNGYLALSIKPTI